MQFDSERICHTGDAALSIGYVYGGDGVVYIKAGLGGDHVGYEEKYLRIARRLNAKYGVSVLSVSNPAEGSRGTEADEGILSDFLTERGITKPRLYFFGHSNGALRGLSLAAKTGAFERLVLINMPLMVNFHNTVRQIRGAAPTRIDAVFGTEDPSVPYLTFLSELSEQSEHLRVFTVEDADHNFQGKTEEFLRCSELLFLP